MTVNRTDVEIFQFKLFQVVDRPTNIAIFRSTILMWLRQKVSSRKLTLVRLDAQHLLSKYRSVFDQDIEFQVAPKC